MSKRSIDRCGRCGELFQRGGVRTLVTDQGRELMCKLCFLKLPEQDRRYRERKSKLPDEVSYSQGELPF